MDQVMSAQRGHIKLISKWALLMCLLANFLGCSMSQDEFLFNEGQKLNEEKKYDKAVVVYEKVFRGYPRSEYAVRAAQEAARIAIYNLKDYKRSVDFLKNIILLGKDPKDLLSAQRQLAEVYFDKLANYQQAIVEYNKLLQYDQSKEELYSLRMSLARANYYQGNFSQALTEIEQVLAVVEVDEEKFQAQNLKANVLLAQKKIEEAVAVFNVILDKYPALSAKENVGLTLAVSLEEKGDFKNAIDVLEKIKSSYPVPDFIKLKIQRLIERREQLPGAQGLKK